MVTKNQKLIYGLAAILLIVLVAMPILNLSVVGVSPLSCDNAAYKSSDENYANGSLFCAMVLSGSGGSADFVFDNNFVRDKFGVEIEKTGTFSAEMDGSMCSYRFLNESNYVYSYKVIVSKETSFGNFVACRNPGTQAGYTYIGSTPATNIRYEGGYKKADGCEFVYRKTEGVIHYLDPSSFNDFNAKLTMTIDGNPNSAVINQTNPTARNDYFTAEYLGGLQGQQSCPAQPSTTGYIANALTPTPLSYKGKLQADAILTSQMTMVDAKSIIANKASHEIIVQNYLASTASTGQYCSINTTPTTSINDAKISCTPVGTTNIPVFNLYVNADKFVIVKPSGTPKIESVSVGAVTAATRAEVIVKATNTGDADSFDFAVKCPKDINPFSARENLASQETKDVKISYEGAGLIGECTVTMTSVNSPDKIATETVKLSIYPFCAKSAPSPAHQMVMTEKGCAFICPNYGNSTDVFDASCGVMSNYDRCNYDGTECTSKDTYTGYHCTGIGKYMKTDAYMDEALEGQVFIPETQEHKYFITTIDSVPVCAYINQYGFSDGVPIDELVFDYSKGFPQATEQAGSGSQDDVPEIPAEPPKGTPTTDLTQPFLYVIGALIVIGGIYWYQRRKR